jgi:hypothetical protein
MSDSITIDMVTFAFTKGQIQDFVRAYQSDNIDSNLKSTYITAQITGDIPGIYRQKREDAPIEEVKVEQEPEYIQSNKTRIKAYLASEREKAYGLKVLLDVKYHDDPFPFSCPSMYIWFPKQFAKNISADVWEVDTKMLKTNAVSAYEYFRNYILNKYGINVKSDVAHLRTV